MAYDPMAYASRKGDYIMQAGQSIASTIASIPDVLMKSEQWKQYKAGQQSEQKAKTNLATQTAGYLRQIGIDPGAIQLPDPNNPNMNSEQYAAKVAEVIAPHVSGPGRKLTEEMLANMGVASNPMIKEEISRQQFLDKNDPMGQISMKGMQSAPAGEMEPMRPPEQIEPDLVNALNGLGGSQIEQPAPSRDPMFDEMSRLTIEAVRNKELSPGKAFEKMLDLKALEGKERLERTKAETAHQKEMDKVWAAGVVGSSDTNYIKDPMTGETDPGLTKDNVSRMAIGSRRPKEFNPNTGNGGRVSAELMDQRNQAADHMKRFTNNEGDVIGGAKVEFTSAKQMYRVLDTAVRLQDAAGGPELLSDVEARNEARDALAIVDALTKIEQRNQSTGGTGDRFKTQYGITEIQMYGDILKTLPESARQSVLRQYNQGKSFQEILDGVRKILTETSY